MIGDIYMQGAHTIVDAIKKLPPGSGAAHWKRCDVTKWEDQVSLFEFAITTFGRIDIVVGGLSLHQCAPLSCTELVHPHQPWALEYLDE